MCREIEQLQSRIVGWANGVMPDRTPQNAFRKLSLETLELAATGGTDPSEMADMMIILLDLFHMAGADPLEECNKKMEINEARSWTFNSLGLLQHKENDNEEA